MVSLPQNNNIICIDAKWWDQARKMAFINCGQIGEIGGRVTNTAKKLSGLFLTVWGNLLSINQHFTEENKKKFVKIGPLGAK